MIDLPVPHGRALERAREVFAELEAVDALLRPHAGRPRRPAASALYALAKDGEIDQEDELGDELGDNARARRVHAHMLAETAQFTFGTLRAASAGAAAERHGDGCYIRIEQSRAEPDQFFIVVQVLRAPTSGQPRALIVCDHDDHCRRYPLPALHNGIAQFIAEAGSDLMRMMDDPKTRVFLG